MFLKIKNKSRFVTVSFLLASLVTVISSASADDTTEPVTEDVFFPFEVEAPPPECSDNDVPATWMPENATGEIVVNPGDSVNVRVDPNFEHGRTDCPDYSLPLTGYVTSTLTVPEDWTSSTECHPGTDHCIAHPDEQELDGSFTVPPEAALGDYVATFSLTWMIP